MPPEEHADYKPDAAGQQALRIHTGDPAASNLLYRFYHFEGQLVAGGRHRWLKTFSP